jgi:6-phosphofructokinase 2
MADIVTLAMNPAIDAWVSVDRIEAFHKLRCSAARRDPGGGGINVARVLKRFGADVTAIYTSGGGLGQLLRRLVEQEGLSGLTVPIANETREDFTVFEHRTGAQFRFVLPGPLLSEPEWTACLAILGELQPGARFVVGSGSLPPGVPEDFYARFAQTAKRTGGKVIVDTAGPPLRAAVEAGVYLIKQSLSEFRSFTGAPLETESELIGASRHLIERGHVEIVALTLGEQGALLVTRSCALHAPALTIRPVSVVGAGDSFLGALIWSLAAGEPIETAFRYAVAAGSAALLAPGTDLCMRGDVERLFSDVKVRVI